MAPARQMDLELGAAMKMMRPIKGQDGKTLRRAALWTSTYRRNTGVLTSGGLRVESVPHLLGIVLGEVENRGSGPRSDAGRIRYFQNVGERN